MLELGDNRHYPADPDRFEFDDEVSEVFDNMALRSIPGYAEHFDMIKALTARTILPDYSQVWDFGCSTGTGLETVDATNRNPLVSFHAVDISPSMLAKVEDKVPHAVLHHHDLAAGPPAAFQRGNVSVAMINWTLQFIEDQDARKALVAEVYDALTPGGYLFISEKFELSEDDLNRSAQQAYLWWRRMNGYSLEEIKAKTRALANSMWPWTPHDLLMALMDGGAPAHAINWTYKIYNFGGVVVRKPESNSE